MLGPEVWLLGPEVWLLGPEGVAWLLGLRFCPSERCCLLSRDAYMHHTAKGIYMKFRGAGASCLRVTSTHAHVHVHTHIHAHHPLVMIHMHACPSL